MIRYFVVSDVHSCYYKLRETLDNAGFDLYNNDHVLIVCGDLFDRGDETVQLFEFAKELMQKKRLIYIRGNHEDLLNDCVYEIAISKVPSSHHWHNKTVKTIADFCGIDECQYHWLTYDVASETIEKIKPLQEFIWDNTLNYFETEKFIFTHGWIPTLDGYADKFKTASNNEWKEARWTNGMLAWTNKANRIENKTIVCGHWHCSFGWSKIRQQRKEFPQLNRKEWWTSFEPFVDDGICAIDSCVAYTGFINCIVIENEQIIKTVSFTPQQIV